MARKFRVEYVGATYHVNNRGDHREDIFLDDEDQHRFLAILDRLSCKPTVMLKVSVTPHAFFTEYYRGGFINI